MEAERKKAKELVLDFVLTVVNKEGHLSWKREDGECYFVVVDIAFKKAYTAAAFLKIDTANLTKITKPTGYFYGLQNDNNTLFLVIITQVNGECGGGSRRTSTRYGSS